MKYQRVWKDKLDQLFVTQGFVYVQQEEMLKKLTYVPYQEMLKMLTYVPNQVFGFGFQAEKIDYSKSGKLREAIKKKFAM